MSADSRILRIELQLFFLIFFFFACSATKMGPKNMEAQSSDIPESGKIDWRLFKPENSLFIRTLDLKYRKNPVDSAKTTYIALLYLLYEDLKITHNFRRMELLKKILECDALNQGETVDLLFKEAFAEYGEGIGLHNSFIEEEIPRRVAIALHWDDYRPGVANKNSPFGLGQLAQDVIRVGGEIDVDWFNSECVDLCFQKIGRLRRYCIDITSGLKTSSVPFEVISEFVDTIIIPKPGACTKGVMPSMDIKEVYRDNLSLITGKVYQEKSYLPLENMQVQPFVFPCPDNDLWNGHTYIGALPWNMYRAGFDIWGEIDKNEKKDFALDFVVYYMVTDSHDTLVFDSFYIYKSITAADVGGSFHKRFYTDPFNMASSSDCSDSTTYSVGLAIRDRRQNRMMEKRAYYSLPNKASCRLNSEAMISSKYQDDHDFDPFNNPWADIPNFQAGNLLKATDSVELWLPICGLSKHSDSSEYSGIIDIFLSPIGNSWKEKVSIKNIQFFDVGDNGQLKFIDSLYIPQVSSALIASMPIKAKGPNAYGRIKFRPPKKKKGQFQLIGSARSFSPSKGVYEIIAVAEKEVYIK
jgi:hypothetical protein